MPRRFCGVLAAAVLTAAPGLRAETAAPKIRPEFWEVAGLTAGDTLNLRAGPSTGDAVVAELARGTVLRNLGCNADAEPWCEVELAAGGVHGWAAARYLQAHPAAPATPAAAPADPAAPLPPAGVLACSLGGKPIPTCPYAIRPEQDGGAEVVVTFPDGFERALTVSQGEISSPDPTDEVVATQAAGATIVEINGAERIEIPAAAIPAD